MAEFIKRYNPNRGSDWNYGGGKWKLSRSKIDLYCECPRCFYLDNKLGTKRPTFPSFNLNLAVDTLFKREFDKYRETKSPHPLMQKYGVQAVPFIHKDLEIWRENFSGIEHKDEATGLLVSGAIDDVWQKPDGSLIVIDYKATCKDGELNELGDSPWEKQYVRQLGVYRWLLEKNGFMVDPVGYLVYANASDKEETFSDTLKFSTTLISAETDVSWIEPLLAEIKNCLVSEELPPIGDLCEHCPYREASGKKLQAIHAKAKKN